MLRRPHVEKRKFTRKLGKCDYSTRSLSSVRHSATLRTQFLCDDIRALPTDRPTVSIVKIISEKPRFSPRTAIFKLCICLVLATATTTAENVIHKKNYFFSSRQRRRVAPADNLDNLKSTTRCMHGRLSRVLCNQKTIARDTFSHVIHHTLYVTIVKMVTLANDQKNWSVECGRGKGTTVSRMQMKAEMWRRWWKLHVTVFSASIRRHHWLCDALWPQWKLFQYYSHERKVKMVVRVSTQKWGEKKN